MCAKLSAPRDGAQTHFCVGKSVVAGESRHSRIKCMTVAEIYLRYRIMPSLQLHQLRVAAVATFIAQKCRESIDVQAVTLAGLFHDMGNIIKSDFSRFPEFIQPEGIEYWQSVKDDFIKKYGAQTHEANVLIAKEIGLPEKSIQLIDGVSFSHIRDILVNGTNEQQIVEYADCRVGPHGVLPLRERLAEARKRYLEGGSTKAYYSEDGFLTLCDAVEAIEQKISAECSLKPDEITDASIAPIIDELKHFQVK